MLKRKTHHSLIDVVSNNLCVLSPSSTMASVHFSCGRIFHIVHLSVPALVNDGFAVDRARLCWRVEFCPDRRCRRDQLAKVLERALHFVLQNVINIRHFQIVRQVPAQQISEQQRFVFFQTADELALRDGEVMVSFDKREHVFAEMLSSQRDILKDPSTRLSLISAS